MKSEPLKLEGHCYILLQGDWIHPIAYRRSELIWYPERSLTLAGQYTYKPYVQSIVTECAWLISLYDRERVRVLNEDGYWVTPNIQTYASSAEIITHHLLRIPSTVAAMPLDGGRQFKTVIKEYAKRIKKAKPFTYEHNI